MRAAVVPALFLAYYDIGYVRFALRTVRVPANSPCALAAESDSPAFPNKSDVFSPKGEADALVFWEMAVWA